MFRLIERTIIVLVAIGFCDLQATADSNLMAKFQRILNESYLESGPGAAVIVTKNGSVLFQGAHGKANIELNVPLETHHVFRIGSLTKQFTAAAIMMLHEKGQISLDDPITKYLPQYPTHGHNITIEHLLTHTSGIFNYTNQKDFLQKDLGKDISLSELIKIFEQSPMQFPPGTAIDYSNSGYVLLGAIIEIVSGKSYSDFMKDNIFKPIHLKSTYVGTPIITPNRVTGYQHDANKGIQNIRPFSMTYAHAAGAIISSINDLAIWNEALQKNLLLTETSYHRMKTKYQLSNKQFSPFGYGFHIDSLHGLEVIQHSGSIPGFSSFALWIPNYNIYIAVLSNQIGAQKSPKSVAYEFAEAAIDAAQ